jgi:hypothetical protein
VSNIIACSRLNGLLLHQVAAGSKVIECANCRAQMWASPATQRMLTDPDNVAYCVEHCAPIKLLERRIATSEPLEFRGVDGWEDEALPFLGQQGVDEAKTFLMELNENSRDSE